MRALLVVNPAATTTSARTREVLASALETDLKLEVAHTRHRGHAAELAAEARADGLDLVVVLGGDGTVNEVVNGLLCGGDPTDVPDVPDLAVVPGGGTNVFSRALGLPRDPVEATGALLDALREHRRRSIGLGLAGDRWFTFNAGMGWDAEVVARVDQRRRSRPTEQRHTHPRTTSGPRSRSSSCTPTAGRRRSPWRCPAPSRSRVHMAIVANTAPWTYLGDRPLLTSPEASFDTGLDLYALTRLRTVGTLSEARRLLLGRPTPDRRGPRTLVHRQHDLAELTLRASRPVAAQVDGEALGDVQSADVPRRPERPVRGGLTRYGPGALRHTRCDACDSTRCRRRCQRTLSPTFSFARVEIACSGVLLGGYALPNNPTGGDGPERSLTSVGSLVNSFTSIGSPRPTPTD